MAGRGELGFPKTSACSLREQLARTTLRNVRLQGHTYVELREDGKRFVFFCTLCLAPCYSDSVLLDHLKGNLHNERLVAAKATLLKPNPWPFNDGVLFFQGSCVQDKQLVNSSGDQNRLLTYNNGDGNEAAIVCHGEYLSPIRNGNISHNGSGCNEGFDSVAGNGDCDTRSLDLDRHMNDRDFNDSSHNRCMIDNGGTYNLVVPGVLHDDVISDLEVRLLGVGQIAARVLLKDGIPNAIRRIWCEWLGQNPNSDAPTVPDHDFAVITFAYNYNLGRKGLLDDIRYLLTSNHGAESEDLEESRKKRRKSFSDPEDISGALSNQYDSSGEDSLSSNSSSSRMLLEGCDDQLLHSRFISSKTMRRKLRQQQRLAAERMCDICQQKILAGKDVATLLNRKTGKVVCSSRNVNGAFHVYHISCLVHWILLCELEIYTKQLVEPKVKRKSRRKTTAKRNGCGGETELNGLRKQIYSAFCPECQGTGINIDGDELEKPTVPLSEMFRYKIKVSDARRAWMKCPEVLQTCSTGFHFPSPSDELVQENVSPLKLLHFYRADG
ncbi:Histidine-rich glycoprotein [Actinidia chinensis var. chinensis]|uniref:Histidine-rich glycoprotein n=1 Tax=Actinidia chinensis var. chinensis TaxID=1590841 RepID=A0A2R6QX87_ACTCC|nr:Histidine-rich glycoprotein [Actinidia chinensis var. chinensis]